MILAIAAALAVQASPASAAACPTVLTQAAQSCRAVAESRAGRFAEAAAAFESAADLAPSGDPAKERALAAAGNMWIAAGQPGKAALALDKALAGTGLQAEQHGLALLDRARAAEAQGDLKTARAKVSEAAKTISEDPYLWFFSAALAVREEDLATAKASINRALALAPDSAEVLFEAGHIAEAGGEDAQARDYWSRAIKADPNGPAGKAAREALAMTNVPFTVTNQVATRPEGDGEGQDKHSEEPQPN
jgi:tetratricopeptide (TPR) repeat protein